MRILPLVKIIFGCVCFFLVSSCIPIRRGPVDTATVESAEIPPDMATEKFILIGMVKNRKSYDKYLRTAFDTYTGKYILADNKEIAANYQDTVKYRYILDYTDEYSHGNDAAGQAGTNSHHFYIRDRKANKIYMRKSWSAFFARDMRTYLQQIEAFRKK